jgi:hypothetical protein
MTRRIRPSLRGAAAIALITLVLGAVGCGEEEKVDPYTYATLDQVTRGFIESKDYLYEIDAPEFVFAHGNTSIVRSGNHLEVLVGDDIENRAPTLDGKLIGVQKFFSPYIWLMARRIKDGLTITELDSVPDPLLPHFTDVKLDEVQGFDISELRWNQKSKIEDMADAEVQTVGTILYLPDHEAEQPEAVEGQAPPEPAMTWYLRAEKNDATFKITNVTPELDFAFRLLEAEGLPFVGGIKIGQVYPYAERKESQVSAPVEVEWIRYANRYLAP